jgi:hypothetical protein
MFNLPRVLAVDELTRFAEALPASLVTSNDARHLIRDLIRQGQTDVARLLLRKRTDRLGWSFDALRQHLQIMSARVRLGVTGAKQA